MSLRDGSGRKGIRLTDEEREEYSGLAFEMKSKGHNRQHIADHIGVHPDTVTTLVSIEAKRRRRERIHEVDIAIGRYQRVILEAWERLKKLPDTRSMNNSSLLRVVIDAQDKIDQITGVRAPVKWAGEVKHIDFSKLTDEELEDAERVLSRVLSSEEPSEN